MLNKSASRVVWIVWICYMLIAMSIPMLFDFSSESRLVSKLMLGIAFLAALILVVYVYKKDKELNYKQGFWVAIMCLVSMMVLYALKK